MIGLLNLFSWVLSLLTFVTIISIDGDLFLFALIISIIVKVILNKGYIEQSLDDYKQKIISEFIISNKNKADKKIHSNLDKENEILSTIDIKSEGKSIEEDGQLGDDLHYVNKYINIIPGNEKSKLNSKEFENKEISEKVVNGPIGVEKEEQEESVIYRFIVDFFSENLMAKIGGILLFVGVIFLMGLVYTYVGPVVKILIGFILGFSIYFIGVKLSNKGHESESMILLGTGILINYIVILSGKFVIGTGIDGGVLSSSLTFLLLILNSVFSVFTAFVYKSKNLLLFSIVFAYVIPFLTGVKYSTYVIVSYDLILTIGGYFISNYFYKENAVFNSVQLLFICLVGGNLLLFFSKASGGIDFGLNIIGFNIINFISMYLLYKNKLFKSILPNFIISYIFLFFLIFSGFFVNSIYIVLFLAITIIGLLAFNTIFVVASIGTGMLFFIFLPLLYVLFLLFSGTLITTIFLIPLFLIIYVFLFSYMIGNILSTILKSFFFAILGIFLLIGNFYVGFSFGLDLYSFSSIFITSFIFLFSSYYLSTKIGLNNLYSIGTLFTVFLLLMIIKTQGQFLTFSVLGLSLFWICNYTLPFLNKNLIRNDIQNMIIGSVIGIIFSALYLYKYGIIYFPGTSMGLAFLVFALFYFFGGYILYTKLISTKDIKVVHENDYNFIYSYLGIAVSLFTISVAFIFSSIPAVICVIWLFQSTLVLYFSKKLNSDKIYYAGIILFLLGIIKYSHYFGTITINFRYLFSLSSSLDFNILGGNYFSNYIGNLFILLPIFLNLKFSKKSDINSISFLEVLHVFGVLIFTSSMVFVSLDLLSNLYNITSYKEAIFTIISLLLLIYSLIYNIVGNVVAKSVLMVSIILLCFLHIFSVELFTIYNYNYLITLIVVAIYLIDYLLIGNNKISNFAGIFKTFLNPLYIYLFLITSIYLYDISYNYFILTIYWGFLSLSFVHIGLFINNKKFRVSGLIILILTLLKITFYDLWNSIDNGIIRVVAFIFTGALMIYISSIYKSKGLKISDDLFPSDNNNDGYKVKSIYENENTDLRVENKDKPTINLNYPEGNSDYIINKNLDKVDIGEKKAVLFIFNDGRKVQIRAKNLIKMGKIIIKTAGKNKFEKGELKYTYDYVKKNYKSELSKRDYDRIIEIIDDFVKNGGSFELI